MSGVDMGSHLQMPPLEHPPSHLKGETLREKERGDLPSYIGGHTQAALLPSGDPFLFWAGAGTTQVSGQSAASGPAVPGGGRGVF